MDETTPLLRKDAIGADIEQQQQQHQQQQQQHAHDYQTTPPPRQRIIDFDPNGDPDNPMDWPVAYKWCIVALLALMAFTVTFTCISVVPVAGRIVADLDGGRRSKSASVLLVTIWELGEAAGPLLLAPLSEVFGRYPVINVANGMFVGATVLAALSQSTTLFIAARFLTGLAVAANVLNPAIVGDMFVSEKRGRAMSFIMLAPLLGGAVGPAISGAVAERVGWRQTLWISAGLAGACELAFLTCFSETYKVVLLNKRAARLRREIGADVVKLEGEVEEVRNETSVWEAILRPMIVLYGSGVLQAMSVFGGMVYTFFYIMSTTLPDILEEIYGMSPALTGSAFITFSLGALISVTLCNFTLDKIYTRLRDSHSGIEKPEYRLPLVILGGFTMPLVVVWYGWSAQLHLPLASMLAATALIGTTLMLGYLPVMSWVVDAFGLYSASAMTAVIITRCLMGTFLPLLTAPLVERFGWGWGFTMLGAVSLALAPVPVLVMRYGERWRQRSRYTRDE